MRILAICPLPLDSKRTGKRGRGGGLEASCDNPDVPQGTGENRELMDGLGGECRILAGVAIEDDFGIVEPHPDALVIRVFDWPPFDCYPVHWDPLQLHLPLEPRGSGRKEPEEESSSRRVQPVAGRSHPPPQQGQGLTAISPAVDPFLGSHFFRECHTQLAGNPVRILWLVSQNPQQRGRQVAHFPGGQGSITPGQPILSLSGLQREVYAPLLADCADLPAALHLASDLLSVKQTRRKSSADADESGSKDQPSSAGGTLIHRGSIELSRLAARPARRTSG